MNPHRVFQLPTRCAVAGDGARVAKPSLVEPFRARPRAPAIDQRRDELVPDRDTRGLNRLNDPKGPPCRCSTMATTTTPAQQGESLRPTQVSRRPSAVRSATLPVWQPDGRAAPSPSAAGPLRPLGAGALLLDPDAARYRSVGRRLRLLSAHPPGGSARCWRSAAGGVATGVELTREPRPHPGRLRRPPLARARLRGHELMGYFPGRRCPGRSRGNRLSCGPLQKLQIRSSSCPRSRPGGSRRSCWC
jgi:hypothetical protein